MIATASEPAAPGGFPRKPRIPRRWLLAGLAGWLVVFVIATVDVAFQKMNAGVPFLSAWSGISDSLLITLAGALLSPLVFAAFARLAPVSAPLRRRAFWYALVGAGFWIAWATLHALLLRTGLIPVPGLEAGFGEILLNVLPAHAFNSLVLYGVMVTLYEAVQYTRAARLHEVRASRLRSELALAEMAALRAQLDPHFLFNTLHVVSGLMARDVPAARRVLADLGELLRGSLASEGARLVPLAAEMRLVERYTDIQKARFGDRLGVEFDIAPGALPLLLPPLLLQPLVENAIHHGVAGIPEGGRVRVGAVRRGEVLELTVTDSGGGFGGEARPARERIGLGGTRARLHLVYGDRAALAFSHPEAGFTVAVSLPAVEEEPGAR